MAMSGGGEGHSGEKTNENNENLTSKCVSLFDWGNVDGNRRQGLYFGVCLHAAKLTLL